MAWLHAVPEGASESRMESLERQGSPLTALPDIGRMEHLLTWLFEVGPLQPGGTGPSPVTFAELHAWSALTGTGLTGEEALLVRSLSRDYCAQIQEGRKRNAAPPFAPGGDRIGAGIMAAFKMSKVNHG